MPTITVFPTQQYTAGTYTSPTANFSGSNTTVEYTIQSTTWTTDDPSIVVTLQGQWSFNGGTTWLPATGPIPFSPGPLPVNKQGQSMQPGGAFTITDTLGARQVNAQMTLTGTLTVGVTAVIT